MKDKNDSSLWGEKDFRTGEAGIFLRPTGSHETDPFINSSTGGWYCPYCMTWVGNNVIHSCYPQDCLPQWQPTWQPTYNPVLDEIKGLLERIIELLARE